jgi:hypothetical protein
MDGNCADDASRRAGDSFSASLFTKARLAAYNLTRLRTLVRFRPQCEQ